MAEIRHEISEFDRGWVVGAHDVGKSGKEIEEMYNFTKSTINRIIKAYKEHGITKVVPRSGRPPKLDNRDTRHLTQIVKKNHKMPLAQITAQMQELTLKTISTRTIQCTLHNEGYYGHVGL